MSTASEKSATPAKVAHTDGEWREKLSPQQYHVLREKGTERPYTGALTENHETGNYHCAGCGALLFLSGAKFDSGCGWPSFVIPGPTPGAIDEHEDNTLRYASHRGHLRPLRRPPGTRVSRRSPTHWPSLLHQLRFAHLYA